MPTINGDNTNNTINGTSGDDEIYAFGGNDVIHPGDGDDIVYAGDGDDLIYWDGGRDTVYGGAGRDIISLEGLALGLVLNLSDGWYIQGFWPTGEFDLLFMYSIEGVIGSNYADSLELVGSPDDTRSFYLDGAGGDDGLGGGYGDDEIYGGEGNDSVISSRGNDMMDGGEGDFDKLIYSGKDAIQGIVADLRTGIVTDEYGGTDTVSGFEILQTYTRFADVIDGSESGEEIRTFGLGDTIRTHGGDDSIWVQGAGNFDGGSGTDTIEFSTVNLTVDPSTDELGRDHIDRTAGITLNLATGILIDDGYGNSGTAANFENVNGTNFDDDITGSDGANILTGASGDDRLYGLGGADTLYGNNGTDRLSGGDGNDLLDAGADSDYIFGGNGNDILVGRDGNDTLVGGAGNDQLWGGSGSNKLVGGFGADLFLISSAAHNVLITDFNPLEDRIMISDYLGPDSFADLVMVQDGRDVVITFPLRPDDSIRLQNVVIEMLNPRNFEFGYVNYDTQASQSPPAEPAPQFAKPLPSQEAHAADMADADLPPAPSHDFHDSLHTFDLPHVDDYWLA